MVIQLTTKSLTSLFLLLDKFRNSCQNSAYPPVAHLFPDLGALRSLAKLCLSISATDMHISGDEFSNCFVKLRRNGMKSSTIYKNFLLFASTSSKNLWVINF